MTFSNHMPWRLKSLILRCLRAIAAGKKKNDKLDAKKIADLLRCDLLPECYMAPTEIRELRRILRYRNLIIRQAVQMKNKISGLLMELGAEYDKKRLHGQKYFYELLENLHDVPQSEKRQIFSGGFRNDPARLGLLLSHRACQWNSLKATPKAKFRCANPEHFARNALEVFDNVLLLMIWPYIFC